MKLANLSIGKRLAGAFGLVCVVLVAMALIGNVMLGRMKSSNDEILRDRMPKIMAAKDMLASVNDIAIALRNMLLTQDAADRAGQAERVLAARKHIAETLEKFDRIMRNPRARELCAQIGKEMEAYIAGQDKLMKLAQGNDVPQARVVLTTELRPLLVRIKGQTNELIKLQQELSDHSAALAEAAHDEARTTSLVLAVVALVFSGGLAWWITGSIVRPTRRALEIANTVAAGDLTSDIRVDSTDEMGQLLAALKAMNDSLARTVTTVRSGTDTIATAAAQVAAGSQDLSSRTEQQASSLEETASSMEELTSTVRQSGDNARQANTLSQDASRVATQGGQVIAQVVRTMDEISAAATKIGDITSVIDGIAFQTNILALNAAVEAARAGEQGRGFAVVASEVRNLAQRSAAAAKEIKELIDDSTQKVATGSALVGEAGTTMQRIVAGVERVTHIMAEITTAGTEQAAGIEQINQAVGEMDSVTQQNAALVEEATAAAEAMREQAAHLADAVAVFRVPAQAIAPQAVARAGLPTARRGRLALA